MTKKAEKEDVYLAIMRWGRDNPRATKLQLWEMLLEKGYLSQEEYDLATDFAHETKNKDDSRKLRFLEELFTDVFPIKEGDIRFYSMESYFRLLEHEELTEARRNAREARWFAAAAIVVALISLLASWGPIKIDPVQLEQIISAIRQVTAGS